MMRKGGLCLLAVLALGCSDKDRGAGAVIDTSTLQAQVQGRNVALVAGRWFVIIDSLGVVDSVQASESCELSFEYAPDQGVELRAESLLYKAYRIVPTDTIRPSPALRFLFPASSAWPSQEPPVLSQGAPLIWNQVHAVWSVDSLAPGRHLLTWMEGGKEKHADLVVHEMANRFELHQSGASISSGSLRPTGCGFALWSLQPNQPAGMGCAHSESDAFNRNGISSADLLQWSDSLLHCRLSTLANGVQTPNPYSKLLLEFDAVGATQDLSSFDTLFVQMDLPIGDSLTVRLAQTGTAVGDWWGYRVGGLGDTLYAVPLDTAERAEVFGVEFRNPTPGRVVDLRIMSLGWK